MLPGTHALLALLTNWVLTLRWQKWMDWKHHPRFRQEGWQKVRMLISPAGLAANKLFLPGPRLPGSPDLLGPTCPTGPDCQPAVPHTTGARPSKASSNSPCCRPAGHCGYSKWQSKQFNKTSHSTIPLLSVLPQCQGTWEMFQSSCILREILKSKTN